MHEVMAAGMKATCDLGRGDILWHALWPPLAAVAIWAVIAWWAWTPLSAWLAGMLPDWSWMYWLGPWLANAAVLLTFAPLLYFTALLLVAVVALPRMTAIIAARDYPDVSRQAAPGSAFVASVWNTVTAGAIFTFGWMLCLPLLLVPGGLLVLPLLWSAWLNQRTFRVDVLVEHATKEERKKVVERERGPFRLAGIVSALVAHVPVVNLLAPAFAALLFTHLGLSALRRLRAMEGVWVSGH